MASWDDLTPAETGAVGTSIISASPSVAAAPWGDLIPAEPPPLPPSTPEASAAPAEVRSAPEQMRGFWRYPALAGEAALRGGIHGLGLLGDILPRPNAGLQQQLIEAGSEPIPIAPTTNELLDFAGRAGLPVKSANLIPEGGERIPVAAVEGAASALPFTPFGPAGALLSGAAGGAAGEAAHQYVPGAEVPVGILAGGLAGLRRPATIESVAKKIGGDSRTLEEAGLALEEAATNWRSTVKDAKIDEARAPLDAAVPPNSSVLPSEVISRANDLVNKGGHQADSVKQFFDSTIKSGGALGRVARDIATAQPVTWEEAKMFRTELGQKLRSAHRGDISTLEHLYGGITSDLGTTANAAGAGDLFSHFNKVSTEMNRFDSGPIEQILTARQSAEAAKKFLLSGNRGGQTLASLRSEMPEAVDELAAAHLRTGGPWHKLSPEGQEALVPDAGLRSTLADLSAGQSRSTSEARSLAAIAWGHAAHALGTLAGGALPGSGVLTPLVTGAGAEILGMGVPKMLRGLRQAASPNLLFPAGASGAAGASNALALPPTTAPIGQ